MQFANTARRSAGPARPQLLLLLALGLGLLLLPGCASEKVGQQLPAGHAQRPDLILLSIDTLRADHLGCYGYARDTSPFLDELARQGTRFTSAWAPSPWTLPSHATLLSGYLPQHHGAIEVEHSIATDIPMLSEVLSESGYTCCGVVTSLLVSQRFGFDRGFAHFQDFGIAAGDILDRSPPVADDVFEQALHWAESQPDGEPLFLFLHVYDVHYPYNAPAPWNKKFNRPARPGELLYENYHYYLKHPLTAEQMNQQRGQYNEEISYVDDAWRRFHTTWLASRQNTVFMVTSDHGEEFGECGSWGHAHTLMPELLHVPWIISGPGVLAQAIEDRVGLEDIAPTLAGLAGASFGSTDGVDRSDMIRHGTASTIRNAAEDHVAARFAATSRRHTLLHRWHDPPHDLVFNLPRMQYTMHDLVANSRATQDILGTNLDKARRMNQDMYAWLGQPWEALAEGTALTTDGVFVVDGQRQNQEMPVVAGQRFALFPADAVLLWQGTDGTASGPWRALGGELPPADDPGLRWHGRIIASDSAPLTEQQKERIRALGYVD